jgi:UDP:flavonoid glycosyltransferase YjiC (YdhE family)
MKLLFSSRPGFGHVYPLMPLALAARAAGHDVEFATTGAFLAKLRALGFVTHDVGMTLEDAQVTLAASLRATGIPRGADGRPDLEIGGRLFIDVIGRPTASELASLLPRLRPDLVVYEQYEFGAAVVAHAAGIPAVCHALSPRPADDDIARFAGARLDRLWAEHQVAPGSFDVFTGDAYLDIFPTVLQLPSFLAEPARMRMRPIPFAEPGASLPAWITSTRRPLVYLTLGTIVATDEVLRPAVDGLGRLEFDVLLALGSAAGRDLGTLPANVRTEAFVDQAGLFRHADLVVHHGGSGTLLGALAHGIPQLLLPKGADQFANADLMAAAGLAAVLEPSAATPETVAAAASCALAHRRPAVDAARDEIAALPHPAEVLDELTARFG